MSAARENRAESHQSENIITYWRERVADTKTSYTLSQLESAAILLKFATHSHTNPDQRESL